jgi:3D (Asp-Asp-Asp) domain-containing protein
MTRALANPTFLRRIAHVSVVALCVASSLALLGAVPADRTGSPTSGGATVKLDVVADVTDAEAEHGLASIAREVVEPIVDSQPELLHADGAVDAVTLPAASIAPAIRATVMRMEVTAYCPCVKCCGSNAQGITASGKLVDYNGGKFVAADTRVLPFGKKLVIPGYADGAPVEVIDRGGAIKGNKLDLYFPTHEEALIWGRQHLDVTVYE